MAAWDGSSRDDGWIAAPNNYFPPGGTSDANADTANIDIDINSNTNNNNSNINIHHNNNLHHGLHRHRHHNNAHHNIRSNNNNHNIATIATIANDVSTHANPNLIATADDAVSFDDLLRALDNHDNLQCHSPFPPLLGFPDNDLLRALDNHDNRQCYNPIPPLLGFLDNDPFFASTDHHMSMSSPWVTTSTNRISHFPRSRISNPCDGALVPPSLQTPSRINNPFPPLPAPPAQTLEQVPAPVEAPASSHHDRDFNLRFSGQFVRRPGSYHPHEPFLRNYQFQSFSDIQDNNPNSFPAAAPSLPSPAVTPTTLSQSVSNTNPHPPATVFQARSLARATEAPSGIDEYFLATLATRDFSSPSLPPQSNLPSPTTLSPSLRSKLATTGQEIPSPSTRRRILHRGGEAASSIKEEADLETPTSGVGSSLSSVAMPPTTRRQSLTGATNSSARKRRPSGPRSPSRRPIKSRRKILRVHDDGQPSPFDDDDDLFEPNGREGSETIDLSNATEVPPELVAPKVDNRVKISKFQCVICMDDTTALTVTHCGHLFCSECLHSSLHIDSMKRTCPVCRAKIDLKDKKGKKSYYHLELKVMTATKKGKRPAGT